MAWRYIDQLGTFGTFDGVSRLWCSKREYNRFRWCFVGRGEKKK